MHELTFLRLSPKGTGRGCSGWWWGLLLWLYAGTLCAQQAPMLTGVVTDAGTGQALAWASVSLLQLPDSTVSAYVLTDVEGRFALPYPDEAARRLLVVQYVGYEDLFAAVAGLQPDTLYRFAMRPLQVALEEVTIAVQQPVRRRDDTLFYDIRRFIDSTEQTVGDVLAKLPGFEVSNQGDIKVMGKPVQRLLIEGEDIAGHDYQLITRTLSADVLESVEVWFNYGENPLLTQLFEGGEVAVNLNLKESHKQSLSGELEAAGGTGGFYDGRLHLVALYGRIKQIATVEASNIGRPASYYLWPGGERPDLVAPTALSMLPRRIVHFSEFFNETQLVDRTRFNHMTEASTMGTLRLGGTWRLRFGGALPRERFRQYTTNEWWYAPDDPLNRTDSIERRVDMHAGRAWLWLNGMAGSKTSIKAGIEHARNNENNEAELQAGESRLTRPAWAHTMALASLTHRWEGPRASVLSAEYLEVAQERTLRFTTEVPVFESLLGLGWRQLRQEDALRSQSWRVAKHYLYKTDKGVWMAGLAWTDRNDRWQLARSALSDTTYAHALSGYTSANREFGLYLRNRRDVGEWQWEGDVEAGLLHHRLRPEGELMPAVDQRLPYLNGGIRLMPRKNSERNVSFWMRVHKNLPDPLLQLDALRLEGRYALYRGMAAPLVRQRFELGAEWQRTRLLPYQSLRLQGLVSLARNAWTPDILPGTQMVLRSWIERPAPVRYASVQGGYERLFDKILVGFKMQPSCSYYESEEVFDGLLRQVRQLQYGLKTSLRSNLDFPINLMVGTRVDYIRIHLRPEGNGTGTTWPSLTRTTWANLYIRPAKDIKVILSNSWFAARARSGSSSQWLQVDASVWWRPEGAWSFRLSANNLTGAPAFVTFTDSSFVQTTFSQQILPRYVMLHLQWKFSLKQADSGE